MLWHIFDWHYRQAIAARNAEWPFKIAATIYDSRFTIPGTGARLSFRQLQPAAPPAPDTDPLSPTHNGSVIAFLLVLNYWL
jgi:hypothetical protein